MTKSSWEEDIEGDLVNLDHCQCIQKRNRRDPHDRNEITYTVEAKQFDDWWVLYSSENEYTRNRYFCRLSAWLGSREMSSKE